MKKIIRRIHLWLSVPVGFIITIICFSGATLVFENEIMELCYPNRYFVPEVKEQLLPVEQMITLVEDQLPDSISISSIQVFNNSKKNYHMGISGRHRNYIYVDPYTGNIRDTDKEGGNFFTTMRRLHRWLLDEFRRDGSISVGKTIVGVSTIIFVFILLTGIISWVPKTFKKLKRSLKIGLKQSWRRILYDLHIAGGIYAALILLVLALTGLTWSFSWYRTGFYKIFGVEMQQNSGHSRSASASLGKKTKQVDYSAWQIALEQLKTQNPDFKVISIQNGSASVSSNKVFGNKRASDSYSFEPLSGEITETKLYKDQDNSGKIRGWIYSVHVGSWGGLFTKIITFLASLLGATLPLTGYYIWWRRYTYKRKHKKRNRL